MRQPMHQPMHPPMRQPTHLRVEGGLGSWSGFLGPGLSAPHEVPLPGETSMNGSSAGS